MIRFMAYRDKDSNMPKYQRIADSLRDEIARLDPTSVHKLPSDNELGERFNTSRLTVIRSLRQLQTEGLVQRRVGSGTFTQAQTPPTAVAHTFGLLIPDLGEGEIFEPICQGMARAGKSSNQALLWGNTSEAEKTRRAEELCHDFISKQVSGVFFAPLELSLGMEQINARIVSQLERASIPIVLLDRGTAPFPDPPGHDLVGIDNWREGFRMADYLLELGCRNLGFVARPGSAPTIDARIAGLNQALWARGLPLDRSAVLCADPFDKTAVSSWLERVKPDGILCGNDFTAAQLMQTLITMGVTIPDDIKIVGFDDVKYASLLPVPLTTLRQPCQDIGTAAMKAMLERLEQPLMAPRTISLACEIVKRRSCGAAVHSDINRSSIDGTSIG